MYNLISKLQSLIIVYFKNNICETIHIKIIKYISNNKRTKKTLNFILNGYSLYFKKNIRKDFVSRTIIILKEKYHLNDTFQFIKYDFFIEELEKTIGIIRWNIKINIVNEIINWIENIIIMDTVDNSDKDNKDDYPKYNIKIDEYSEDKENKELEIDESSSSSLLNKKEKWNFIKKFWN